MFSVFRNRFGIPGVIAVIALVFAMLGGAYAANNSGNGSKLAEASKRTHKKKKAKPKRGPRGPRGKTGPAGPQGPVGPQGPKGDPGTPGLNGQKGATGATGADGVGTKGDQGDSVVLLDEAPAGCEAGGYTYGIEGTDEENEVCNGVDGETGFTATLPPGATETGAYGFTMPGATGHVGISFPISLPAEIESDHVVMVTPAEVSGETVDSNCTVDGVEGNRGNPLAAPGYLCIYSGTVAVGQSQKLDQGVGASRSGADLFLGGSTAGTATKGSFAVTAPVAP